MKNNKDSTKKSSARRLTVDDERDRVVQLVSARRADAGRVAKLMAAYIGHAQREGRELKLFDRDYARQFFSCLVELHLRRLVPAWTPDGSFVFPKVFDDPAVTDYPHDVVVRAAFRHAKSRATRMATALRTAKRAVQPVHEPNDQLLN